MAEDTKSPYPDGAAPVRSRRRRYAGYFFLSVVSIAAIAGGLALNYRLIRQYEVLGAVSSYWSRQLTDYAILERLLSEANAPGNDIFASRDPATELVRLDSATARLEEHLGSMRERQDPPPAGSRQTGDRQRLLGEIEAGIADMSSQTRRLLGLFSSGELADAAGQMALMDRAYRSTFAVVNDLREEVQTLQRVSWSRQVEVTRDLRTLQYAIGAFLAALAVGVVLYGFRLSREMKLSDVALAEQLDAFEASQRRFRELTEGSLQGIAIHSDGVLLFVNDTWARIHGFKDPGQALATENIADLVVPDDRESVSDIQHDLQHGRRNSRQYEYRARHRDGGTIWLECQERIVEWQGKPALQAAIIDVSARKQAEAGLHDALLKAEQATTARTRFFAAASHDLRQPLHAISLYLPLLLKRTKQSESREMLEAIQNSCNAMRSLLESLLDISRLDAGVIEAQVEPVSLLEIFDQLGMEFAPQAEAKGLELRVVPADYWVRSDAALLERILRNLLNNAVSYTPRGKILLGARRAGGSVRIEAWDTGIGIDHGTLQHVFEEFYQADNPERDRSRGLGLGLAIVKRVATLLGHELGVRSWPGRGSVFHVTLPAAIEPATEAGPPESLVRQRAGLEDRVVLLIDDDPMVLEGTQAMLEDWGCAVIAAASTSEAVEKVASGVMTPDVAIADLRLRGTETGLAAIASLNEVLAQPVPAVIVTGDTDPGRIRQVSASGLIILHKPVEPAKLKAALTDAIRGNSQMNRHVGSSHQTAT